METLLSAAASSIDAAGRAFTRVAERVARTVPSVQSAVRDTMDQTTAKLSVKAGAVVIRTANELIGTIIDLFA
jgi:hypothetical protein